jgi:lipopolysaccharide transport system permease protein
MLKSDGMTSDPAAIRVGPVVRSTDPPVVPDRVRLVITPGLSARNYWRDIWRYRELMYFLAWRDIAVRYKQTAIGVAWALLRPALTMLAFVAFRRLAGVAAGPVPEALLVSAAVLPWQFFSTALTEASGSLIGNANLVSKVYFPRLIIPWASVVTSFVDFLITLGMLGVLMAYYAFAPDWRLLFLPAFIILVFSLSLGLGLLLAALNVKYRDFRYVVPFIVQFGLFVSPIAFTTARMPAKWRTVLSLNPMVGAIDGFRWSILRGSTPLDPWSLTLSALVSFGACLFGVWYFRRTERTFADLI